MRFMVALLVWVSLTAVAVADEATPLRILPLGDSITQGNNRDHAATYRYELWRMLVDRGIAFDFVGSVREGADGPLKLPDHNGRAFDADHEGHWGAYTDQFLRDDFGDWLAGYDVDIVLMHLGHNDAFRDSSVQETTIKLGRIIEKLQKDNPRVTVLLAKVIPTVGKRNGRIAEYNEQMERIAQERTTEQSRVVAVDLSTGFDPATMTVDGTHPNEAGARWMAERWMAALEPMLVARETP